MADSTNTRIKSIRKALNISQKEFSRGIYISQSFYAELESKNKNVNDRIIELIATKYNVNKDWILTGNGEMFSAPPPDVKLEQLIGIFNELNGLFQDYILLQTKELLKIQKQSGDASNNAGGGGLS
jgi:transcriptional regulator with XRE-family HTH domain